MRIAGWVAVGTIGVLALLAAGVVSGTRRVPVIENVRDPVLPVPIMTMEQYDSIEDHPRPYVFEVSTASGGGALLFFGSTHTKDVNDPQLADVSRRWEAFHPTLALVESMLGLYPGFLNPVREFGEMGYVGALARADGVTLRSWEPAREEEVRVMLRDFPPAQVAMFYVLRPYFGAVRFGRPSDPEGFVEEYRRKRTAWPGLEGTIPDIASLDSLWKREVPDGPDWRDVSDEYRLPGFLPALFSRSNAIRDEHLAAIVLDRIARGERIFVIAGSSHAVKLEGALRAAVKGER
jgi:hypothetical protein